MGAYWDKQHLVEVKFISNKFCDQQMSEMNRIEGATEKANSLGGAAQESPLAVF